MILVCGASGTTGGATVDALLTAGAPVRAFTRNAASYAAPDGVEVAVGSFDDPASLERALDGAEQAYLVVNETEAGLAQRMAFVDVAERSGVRHVVYLSAFGAGEAGGQMRFAAEHGEVEERLRASEMVVTALRPNAFMQNYLAQVGTAVGHGSVYTPMSAEARVSLVDARDIGEMAAAALTQERHAGRDYTLTGQVALTDGDVAACFATALGRAVSHVQVPVEAACEAMLAAGAHPYMVGLLPQLWAYYEGGGGAVVSGDVERVLGRPARGFDQFLADHAPLLAS